MKLGVTERCRNRPTEDPMLIFTGEKVLIGYMNSLRNEKLEWGTGYLLSERIYRMFFLCQTMSLNHDRNGLLGEVCKGDSSGQTWNEGVLGMQKLKRIGKKSFLYVAAEWWLMEDGRCTRRMTDGEQCDGARGRPRVHWIDTFHEEMAGSGPC